MSRNPVVAVFPSHVVDLLGEVETLLQSHARSRSKLLESWNKEPVGAGGKRVRPLLLLTAFHACVKDEHDKGERLAQALDASASIELIHTASLVHDDVMDEAKERRGRPSTYHAHGRDAAILVGDYLFTEAFALAAGLPTATHNMITDACRRLCEGQVLEQDLLTNRRPDPDAYTAVIRDKTASLLAAACGIGATLAGGSQAQSDALYRYGDAIGHAFQVLDDVLDVAGDPQWTGKPAGTDFVAGTMSGPYLHFVERGGVLPQQRRKADFPDIRKQLFETGSVAASQLEASGYTQAALLALEQIPPSPSRDALASLAELLMERAQ